MKIKASTVAEFQDVEAITKNFPEKVRNNITVGWKHSSGIYFFEIYPSGSELHTFGNVTKIIVEGGKRLEIRTEFNKNTLYFQWDNKIGLDLDVTNHSPKT